MPADSPISLKKHRKARARVDKARRADANAVKFGRTKAQRDLEAAEARKMGKTLDQHRREE